jgi:hypothetical protein
MAIIEAILAGERDPEKLAQLRDPHIRTTSQVVAQSLVGDYRREHLFALRQSLAAYRYYHALITACDQEIEACLGQFDSQVDCRQHPFCRLPGILTASHEATKCTLTCGASCIAS